MSDIVSFYSVRDQRERFYSGTVPFGWRPANSMLTMVNRWPNSQSSNKMGHARTDTRVSSLRMCRRGSRQGGRIDTFSEAILCGLRPCL